MVLLDKINLKDLKELYDFLAYYNNCNKIRTYHTNKFDLITILRNTGLVDESNPYHLLIYDRDKWKKFKIKEKNKGRYDRGQKVKTVEVKKKKITLDFK